MFDARHGDYLQKAGPQNSLQNQLQNHAVFLPARILVERVLHQCRARFQLMKSP
ncbi:hypothetical protein OIU79_021210 [Salix purpurea]|uniref:Uncharacterized protein n=1 Tax=Salix purpurea TaxID=77065 RepID=A0A9Q0WQZ7_SALPP|nr:hypothetical protein OIU79_021210 [Salix purpurea]